MFVTAPMNLQPLLSASQWSPLHVLVSVTFNFFRICAFFPISVAFNLRCVFCSVFSICCPSYIFQEKEKGIFDWINKEKEEKNSVNVVDLYEGLADALLRKTIYYIFSYSIHFCPLIQFRVAVGPWHITAVNGWDHGRVTSLSKG